MDQIMSPNIELNKKVNVCRSSHSFRIFKASAYLSTFVARKRSIYNAGCGYIGGRGGGCFNGRGRDRGRVGRGGRDRVVHNQRGCGLGSGAYEILIDISDLTCYFEDSEWDAISNDTRKRITDDPVCTKFLANKKRRTTSSVSSEKDNKNRLIY